MPALQGGWGGLSPSSRGHDARHDASHVRQVIPMLADDATRRTPPDLPSFLFKERIVYLVRCLIGESGCSGMASALILTARVAWEWWCAAEGRGPAAP